MYVRSRNRGKEREDVDTDWRKTAILNWCDNIFRALFGTSYASLTRSSQSEYAKVAALRFWRCPA